MFLKGFFFLTLFLISFLLFGALFWPFLTTFLLAILLTSVFDGSYTFIKERLRLDKNLSALLICLLIVAAVILPISILTVLIGQEAFSLFLWAKEHIDTKTIETFFKNNTWLISQMNTLESTLSIDLSPEALREHIGSVLRSIGFSLYSNITTLGSNLLNIVFNFFLLIFILFYFFRDGNRIMEQVRSVIPLSRRNEDTLIQKFREVGKAVFWGNFLSCAFQGAATGLGFLIFGMGNILLASLGAAFFSLIPVVGTLLIYVPAAIFLWATKGLVFGISFLIYGIITSNVIDNFIKPKLIESKIKVHPLLVFFSILGGVQIFGIFGILYGPMIITIFLSIVKLYEADFQPKKE
jgi:predicted PurR-regulated permease PerM